MVTLSWQQDDGILFDMGRITKLVSGDGNMVQHNLNPMRVKTKWPPNMESKLDPQPSVLSANQPLHPLNDRGLTFFVI